MQKVCLKLSNGKEINLELLPEYAPLSCENFLKLVKDGFYDGVVFHRIIDGFMIQTGGYYIDGNVLKEKEKTATIKGEFASNGVTNDLKHTVGVLSMARTMVKDSASSQFFICVADTPHLDGQYAAFGRCADEESVKVAVEVGKIPTGYLGGAFQDFPVEPICIEKATIIEE